MSWNWAALMPHPPIIVPEVGQGREKEAVATLNASRDLARRLAERKPNALFVMSPHQPYATGALFINESLKQTGSLERFGAPSVTVHLCSPQEDILDIAAFLTQNGVSVRVGQNPNLTHDHGTLVPLYWLKQVWEELPPVVLTSPIGLPPAEAYRMGEVLAQYEDGCQWGLLASGDLSHRLKPDAPTGYDPFGTVFDAMVVEALRSKDASSLKQLSYEDLENAGECGLRSVMTLLGLTQNRGGPIDVLSYEGPFGVGYCNALWEANPHDTP